MAAVEVKAAVADSKFQPSRPAAAGPEAAPGDCEAAAAAADTAHARPIAYLSRLSWLSAPCCHCAHPRNMQEVASTHETQKRKAMSAEQSKGFSRCAYARRRPQPAPPAGAGSRRGAPASARGCTPRCSSAPCRSRRRGAGRTCGAGAERPAALDGGHRWHGRRSCCCCIACWLLRLCWDWSCSCRDLGASLEKTWIACEVR